MGGVILTATFQWEASAAQPSPIGGRYASQVSGALGAVL